MKRFIMPASALFAACVLMFSGCNKEEPKTNPPVIDTVKTDKKADTTVVLHPDSTVVKSVNTDSLRKDSIERAEKEKAKEKGVQAKPNKNLKSGEVENATKKKTSGNEIKLEPNKNEPPVNVQNVKKKP